MQTQIKQSQIQQIINGVAHFTQSTAPTERVGGDALVAGDRWYNPTTRDNWFWNGTYWLSPEIVVAAAFHTTLGSVQSAERYNVKGYFLRKIEYAYATSGVLDENNFWTFTFDHRRPDGAFYSVLDTLVVTAAQTIGSGSTATVVIKDQLIVTAMPAGFRITRTATGSPGIVYFSAKAYYHRVHS